MELIGYVLLAFTFIFVASVTLALALLGIGALLWFLIGDLIERDRRIEEMRRKNKL